MLVWYIWHLCSGDGAGVVRGILRCPMDPNGSDPTAVYIGITLFKVFQRKPSMEAEIVMCMGPYNAIFIPSFVFRPPYIQFAT